MNVGHRRGCPTDGELRLSIHEDGSVEPTVQQHLDSCETCRQTVGAMSIAATKSSQALTSLAPQSSDVNVDAAYSRFRMAMATQMDTGRDVSGGRMRQLFERRSMRAASAFVAIIAVVLTVSLSPMRTVADDFLSQFRVQKFAAVTIPMDLISPIQSAALDGLTESDKQRLEEEFNKLGAFDTTFGYDKENLPAPVTLDEAEAQFGDIDEPGDLPDGFDTVPTAYLTEAGTASYALDTANAQALVDALGLPIYSLPDPALYPTLEFTANVPAAAILEYKDADGKRIFVGQMTSPTLDIPDGLNMDNLREDILRFPGLPTDLVAQLRSIEDWESTLIIPIPEDATSDNITINGEPGLQIDHALGSVVLWEKDGFLFAVIGQASDDDIRSVADSMQ